MRIYKASPTAAVLLLLLLTPVSAFAQEAARESPTYRQNNPLGRPEVPDSEEQRRFVGEHSFTDPTFRRQQGKPSGAEAVPPVQGTKQVRVIYLVPSDRSARADYQNAIANAISDLQRFYRTQLGGGNAFSIHAPVVEVYQPAHPAAFYSTGDNSRPGGFFETVLADGFDLTGGGFNDPNNRWVFYVDADPICGQYIGGNAGVALLAANDLRGLTGQPNVPPCPAEQPDTRGVNRWIGGLGHELAHTFNVPHPPGCDEGSCTGGTFAANSLMWVGYASYPNTYLLDENKTQLLASGFFNVLTLDPSARYGISGRVTNDDDTPLGGATVTISETQATVVSDVNGNFNFAGLPAGGNYTVSAAKAGLLLAPAAVFFNNLDRNQVVNFSVAPRISGQVTQNNIGLPGVLVFLIGSQSGSAVTDATGDYSFFNLSVGGSYSVIPSKLNYTFTPPLQTFNQLSGNQVANFSARPIPGIPVLISEETSTRALALDSVLRLPEPFQPTYQHPWSVDERTRVLLFATNFELSPGETASAVTADAEDSAHQSYVLPVEYVGKVPGFDWLSCIIVRLDVGDVGDVLVRIKYHGFSSNRVRVGIGHLGGGPPDDAGAIPTPGRPPQ